jgi:hypothetical protein
VWNTTVQDPLWRNRRSVSFEAALQREKRTTGFFVAFDYSEDALEEISAFFKRSGIMIRALTVKDILDEQIARKLV